MKIHSFENLPAVMDTSEVAAAIGKGPAAIRRAVKAGTLRANRQNPRCLIFRREDVWQWLGLEPETTNS